MKRSGIRVLALVLAATSLLLVGCGSKGAVDASQERREALEERRAARQAATTPGAESEATPEPSPTATPEPVPVYAVGDRFKADDMDVVYMACGDHEGDSLLEAAEGMKHIYTQLYFENNSEVVKTISAPSFVCYADGEEADQYYGNGVFTASLAPGRAAVGMICFDIPKNARSVEIEYQPDWKVDRIVKLSFEGDRVANYAPTPHAEASADAHGLNDAATNGTVGLTMLSAKRESVVLESLEPETGYKFISVQFAAQNLGEREQKISSYSLRCYADGLLCNSFPCEEELNTTLYSGSSASGYVVYQVPENASVVEIDYMPRTAGQSVMTFGCPSV